MSLSFSLLIYFTEKKGVSSEKLSRQHSAACKGLAIHTRTQGKTYCKKVTILYKDCLVMKKIGNRPITEADTNFSKVSERFQEVSRGFAVSRTVLLTI